MAERRVSIAAVHEEELMEAAPDTETLTSRLKELSECARIDFLHDDAKTSFKSLDAIEGYLNGLLNVSHEIKLDDNLLASLGHENSEKVLTELKIELTSVEDRNRKIDNDIMWLIKTINEDSLQLYSDLPVLEYSMKLSRSMDVHESHGAILNCNSMYGGLHGGSNCALEDEKFKVMKFNHQIENAKHCLCQLKNYQSFLKWDEAIGQLEDALSWEAENVDFEGSLIRLSLRTPIAPLDGYLQVQKLDSHVDSLVLYHELLIEVSNELELKNMEIFPNDICLDNIISAAKVSRRIFTLHSTLLESSLEWLVRKVKQQIFLCNVRHLIIKDLNSSRHSLEYSDIDGIITAHTVSGIEAIIKFSQGWPVPPSAFHLISVKGSKTHLNGVSVASFHKIKERANLLDVQVRCHLPRFLDAVEEIFFQEIHHKI